MEEYLTADIEAINRYVGWFHELDSWTEYWDIYHPESLGRFYFGDDKSEPGLLSFFLPRSSRPLVFIAWVNMALHFNSSTFKKEVQVPEVASAITEVDKLLDRLFRKYFGDASDPEVQADYLNAIFLFASNTLPPATERDQRISESDPRKSTAGRHTLEGDIMWFAWGLQVEASYELLKNDSQHPRRNLLLAGITVGCPVNFAWKGHRRTRPEYTKSEKTKELLLQRGLMWANNFDEARKEVHALYRIREWGSED